MSRSVRYPIPRTRYLPGVVDLPSERTGREIGTVFFGLYWPRFYAELVPGRNQPQAIRYRMRADETLPISIVPPEGETFELDTLYRQVLVVPLWPESPQYAQPFPRPRVEKEVAEIARIVNATFALMHEEVTALKAIA